MSSPTRTACALLGALALALACASGGGSASTAEATEDSPYSSPPAGSDLAEIEEGMDPTRVQSILGAPDHQHSYPTGKSWIPFYYGSDLERTEWRYRGQGRVVFSRNRWSGALKVIRVLYNPDEMAE